MEKTVVIGLKKFSGKDGRKFCHLYVERDFAQYETKNTIEFAGRTIETIWIPENLSDLITEKCVGKQVNIVADYVAGKTYINDVQFM